MNVFLVFETLVVVKIFRIVFVSTYVGCVLGTRKNYQEDGGVVEFVVSSTALTRPVNVVE